MTFDEIMMQRCLDLALLGSGHTAPNPMVGSVIVYQDKIIGEGYHQKYGMPHAEINALNAVKDKSLLPHSVLYVSLEPCSHYGKTPPCCNRIVIEGLKKVVVGTQDTTSKVNGKGIHYLKQHGVEVTTPLLEDRCRLINKRFFTFHEKKRPYIILKWAQSADGFIAPDATTPLYAISNPYSKILSHRWRTEESVILVGTNTARVDNPQLNARLWKGRSPVRAVIDRKLSLPSQLHLFDQSQPTLVFNETMEGANSNNHFLKLNFNENIPKQITEKLFELNLNSLLVEGGSRLLQSFIDANLWDEVRIISSDKRLSKGIKAPVINITPLHQETIDNDMLHISYNL
jgi:diaminohydroxyphosphoribosylaminopyrimidine deaminase/5-amino-6-(5-phosphoribosylamino)uracil reductase